MKNGFYQRTDESRGSRHSLSHRQFGILVTTSYVNSQASQEIIEDQHPILVLAASDIARLLVQKGIATTSALRGWLAAEFPI